jgi:uncharacterized protein
MLPANSPATAPTILILPGLFDSDDDHWQSLWDTSLPHARRVVQRDWMEPRRADWLATLDAAINDASAEGEVVLAAHSLGCALAVHWASQHPAAAARLKGALLVAPADVERADFPDFVHGFAPMPRGRLPFRTIVVASSDDPWCELSTAQTRAADWGAEFHDIGPHGHINAASGLGDWPQGKAWLASLAAD